MLNFIKKKTIESRENDALLFEYVLKEVDEGTIVSSLWAKAIAFAEGNDSKIKPLYMQYRVQSIKDELTMLKITYDELKRDALFHKLSSIFSKSKQVNDPLKKVSQKNIQILDKNDIQEEENKKKKADKYIGLSQDEKNDLMQKELDAFFDEENKNQNTEIAESYTDEDTQKRIKEIEEALKK